MVADKIDERNGLILILPIDLDVLIFVYFISFMITSFMFTIINAPEKWLRKWFVFFDFIVSHIVKTIATKFIYFLIGKKKSYCLGIRFFILSLFVLVLLFEYYYTIIELVKNCFLALGLLKQFLLCNEYF